MYLNDLSAIQKLNCMCTFVLQRGAAFSRLVQVVRMLLSSASVLQISYMLNIEVGENGPEWGDREKGREALFRSPISSITGRLLDLIKPNFKPISNQNQKFKLTFNYKNLPFTRNQKINQQVFRTFFERKP